MFKTVFAFLFFITLLPSVTLSQWSNIWSSTDINSAYASGWVSFQKSGDNSQYAYYIIDGNQMQIMDGSFSETPRFTYNFTAAEQTAGNQIYSLGEDLTNDGIVEFYVLAYSGSSDNYRQSFKIIDFTTGNTIFEKDHPNYYYSYPVVWDVDGNGTLDCTFTQSDYPDYTAFSYQVFDTGAPTSANSSHVKKLNFKLNQNYPNPFNPSTIIEYSINKPGNVSIDIYDISGRLIRNLFSGFKNSGQFQLIWDGRNSLGETSASGTYFYQINYNGAKLSKKMILLK